MDNEPPSPITTTRTLRPAPIIVAVIILIVLVAGGTYLLVHHHNSRKAAAKVTTSQARPPKPKTTPTTPAAPAVPTPTPQSKQQVATNPSPTSNGTSNATNHNLSNTGPGQTIGIFVGTVAVATVAHYLYRWRRATSTS